MSDSQQWTQQVLKTRNIWRWTPQAQRTRSVLRWSTQVLKTVIVIRCTTQAPKTGSIFKVEATSTKNKKCMNVVSTSTKNKNVSPQVTKKRCKSSLTFRFEIIFMFNSWGWMFFFFRHVWRLERLVLIKSPKHSWSPKMGSVFSGWICDYKCSGSFTCRLMFE